MRQLLLEAAEQAVREMCADRGYSVRPYAGAWLISGDKFSLVVTSLAHVTATQLDPAWLVDDTDDLDDDIEDLGIPALDGLVEAYE